MKKRRLFQDIASCENSFEFRLLMNISEARVWQCTLEWTLFENLLKIAALPIGDLLGVLFGLMVISSNRSIAAPFFRGQDSLSVPAIKNLNLRFGSIREIT